MSDWKDSGRKKSPQMMNDTLMNIFRKNYCIFHLTGNCSNKSCHSVHMERGSLFQKLQRTIQDPMSMPNLRTEKSDILNHILKNTDVKNYKMPPYITSCWYHLRNKPCNNTLANRCTNYVFNFGGNDIRLNICYPEMKMCKTRATCGLHFNIDFEFQNNHFKIKKLVGTDIEHNDEVEEEDIIPDVDDKEIFPILDTNVSTDVGTNVSTDVSTNVGTNIGTNVGTNEKDKLISELREMVSELKETVNELVIENQYLKKELKALRDDEIIKFPVLSELPPLPKERPLDPFLDESSYDSQEDNEYNFLEENNDYWQDLVYEDGYEDDYEESYYPTEVY